MAYLTDRGFDIPEPGPIWDVAFCQSAEGIYAGASRRIVVPIQFMDLRVGWQARYVGELDWKATGVPKYYTMSNFKTGKVLYNHELASLHKIVVVCEGVADVWAVGEPGVTLFGKQVGRRQEELLSAWAAKGGLIVLLLDPGAWTDPAKHAAFLAASNKHKEERVVEVALPGGRDPGQYDRRALWKVNNRQMRAAGFNSRSYRQLEPTMPAIEQMLGCGDVEPDRASRPEPVTVAEKVVTQGMLVKSAQVMIANGNRSRGFMTVISSLRRSLLFLPGTISRRNRLTGQLVAEFHWGQLEELAEAQLSKLQTQQPVGRLPFAAPGPEAT